MNINQSQQNLMNDDFEDDLVTSQAPDDDDQLPIPSIEASGTVLSSRHKSTGAENQIVLEEGQEVIIGSSPDSDFYIDDSFVSGRHLSAKLENGEVTITDFGSTNGTYLMLTEPITLNEGDVLVGGKTEFRLDQGK